MMIVSFVISSFTLLLALFSPTSGQTPKYASFQVVKAASDNFIQTGALGDVIIIDVRTPKEYKEGHIPGSVNIPVQILVKEFNLSAANFETKYGFPKPAINANNIILTCRSGVRATNAFRMLKRKYGYQNFMVYKGSWLDWMSKNEVCHCPPKSASNNFTCNNKCVVHVVNTEK